MRGWLAYDLDHACDVDAFDLNPYDLDACAQDHDAYDIDTYDLDPSMTSTSTPATFTRWVPINNYINCFLL